MSENGDTVTMAIVFSTSVMGMMAANFISGEVLVKRKKKKKRSSKDGKKKQHKSKRKRQDEVIVEI
jgi:hypothetical protein